MKKVLVISAHPDDETLGCGGTLLRHISEGDQLAWLIITNISEKQGYSPEKVAIRQTEIQEVANTMGCSFLKMLNYPTMQLSYETLIELIPKIGKFFQEYQPQIVYTVNRSDAHSDHFITFKAVMACTKSFRYSFIERVLMYECISETEFAPPLAENVFIPNYFVNIGAFIEKKIELMKLYSSEIGQHPFPRSERNIRALATFRGATAGMEYAEAFQILKWFEK